MNSTTRYGPERIKEIAMGLGADLCGVANADRFHGAPSGHHPRDIYQDCRSVIVVAKRIPLGTLKAGTCVPYTIANRVTNQEVDRLTSKLSVALEDLGMIAVPVPSDDPYEHWEADRRYGRGILSMRHAGNLAGLGVLGRNTLLKNDRYGSMLQLGAVLVNTDIEPDPIATYKACPDSCHKCIDSCPVKALDGVTVDQKLCRSVTDFVNERGHSLMKCNQCRRVCPQNQMVHEGK
ncbi:MAG: hypothetical protein WC375_12375 [Methanomassiliicoccales archaeon]